jgi:hypothetical protein
VSAEANWSRMHAVTLQAKKEASRSEERLA